MFDCTDCTPLEQLVEGYCFTCDDKPGFKYPEANGATECEEIRGDGYNYGVY